MVALLAVLTAVLILPAGSRAETVQYTYDFMQRLTRVTQSDGTTIDYVYDALGNRLMKTTTLPGAPSNQPPAAVTNPSIANGVTNVPTTATLSWSPAVDPNSGDSVVYFIYFGTSPAPPLAFSGWTTNWSPGKLRGLTTYYWQVVARDTHSAQTASPVWSFTTGNEPPVADFAASPTNGWAPLAVTFSDRSFDTDNAIVSWQWDFDNNGTLDSTNRNPTFTYTTPGDYTVRLTVRDAAGATNAAVKTNYITVLGTNIVDLALLGLTVESAGSYRHLTVTYSITNQGTVSLSGRWQWADACYISTNAVLDAQDTQVGIFYENQSLPAGAVYVRTNVVTIPDVAAQNYYLLLKADANNQIGEISEANNVRAIPLSGRLPDLVGGDLRIAGQAVAGGPIEVSWAVTNRGLLEIDAEWYDGFYLSTDPLLGAQDVSLGAIRIDRMLAPGDRYAQTNTITLAARPPGNYYLILSLDNNNELVETSEQNNMIAVPITLTVPDLAPVAFGAASNNVMFYPGSPQSPTVWATWAVTNQGTGEGSGYWRDQVYVSTNGTVSGAVMSQTFGESWSSLPLTAEAVYRRTKAITLPQQSGTYWLIFQADTYNFLYESNESNNVLAASVPVNLTYEVRPPDLAPLSVNVTGSGQMLQVVYAVTNRGTGTASGTWADTLYLSTNAVWDKQDTLVGIALETNAVPSAGWYVRTNQVRLPHCLEGSNFLILKVDEWNGVVDSVETNDTLAVPITVTPPDLMPVSVTAPASVGVCSPVQVVFVVTNRGPGTASGYGGWVDRLYFSTNAVWDEQDVGLALALETNAVPSMGWYSQTNTVSLPTWARGTNYLILKVDDWDYLCESVETNNTLVVPLVLTAPDLVPVALRVPSVATAAPNASVTMIWGVTNQGAGPAGCPWVDGVYVSTTAALDSMDPLLLSRYETDTVPAAGSYWRTNTLRLPAVPSGTYYLIFKADVFNWLYESDESNNVAVAVPVTYINLFPPPDLMPVALQVPPVVTGPPYPSVTLVWGVTNKSAGPAWGDWYDKLYLSTNAVLDGTATSVGVWSETNTVVAGGSYWRTNTVWVPVVQSGTYYLIFVTDSGENLYESAETNNRLAVPVTIVVTNAPDSQFRILAATGSEGAHPFSLVELRVNPAAEVLIGPSDFYTALDFSPEGELYAAGSELHILNPTNGTVNRVVGTLRSAQASSLSVDSIAFSPDGRLYAVARNALYQTTLYQVDPTTAFATEIGPIEGEYVWGIDFAPDGTLYGAEFDLVVLDPATGRVPPFLSP